MVNSSTHLDRSFLALSHPVRRGILERLARGPATVGEATKNFSISKPAVTKHLRVLEEAGILERVVEGRTHRLILKLDPLDEASDWIEQHRTVWARKFEVVEEHLKEEKES